MANVNLSQAKKAKNDEFYTQYHDIEREMNAYLEFNPNVFRDKTILLPCDDPDSKESAGYVSNFLMYFAQNFTHLGIKKLIATSYALKSKQLVYGIGDQIALPLAGDEMHLVEFKKSKKYTHGRKIILTAQDTNDDGKIDIKDTQWKYLQGDGDFRSKEVTKLRDEADMIITNPPFSLFREFLAWIVDAEKQFSIIGNMNAITYKEVFPLIAQNRIWLGNGFNGGNAYFRVPFGKEYAQGVYDEATGLVKFRNCLWFTNIDHGKRHQKLKLMTMADNLKFNKQMRKIGKYYTYDNYDAIEVPYTMCIPSDYEGVMGVPISFLDKYNPDQFEIVAFRKGDDGKDLIYSYERERGLSCSHISEYSFDDVLRPIINGKKVYRRITIRHRYPRNDQKRRG